MKNATHLYDVALAAYEAFQAELDLVYSSETSSLKFSTISNEITSHPEAAVKAYYDDSLNGATPKLAALKADFLAAKAAWKDYLESGFTDFEARNNEYEQSVLDADADFE